MEQSYISREAVALLGAKIESLFSTSVLNVGFSLYNEGAIRHIWVDDFFIVHAIVADGSDYKLQLDLDFFQASECACPVNKHCPHMASVFFELYNQHGKPEDWLENVLTPLCSQEEVLLPAGGASDTAAEGRTGGHREMSFPALDVWPVVLEKEYEKLYRRHNDRYKIDIFFFTAYKKLCAIADGWEPSANGLFHLYCALFVLGKADQHFDNLADEYPHSYYSRVTADLNDHFLNKIRDAVRKIDTELLHNDWRVYGEVIRNLLRRTAVYTQTAFDWAYIQRYLWTHLLFDPLWIEEECRYLSGNAPDSNLSAAAASRTALTAAQLNWLLGHDEEAMRWLLESSVPPIAITVSYMETHAKSGSWDRLGKWLEFTLPCMRRASSDQFHRVLSFWRDYARQTDDEASLRNALSSLLPRSYPQFTDFLLKTNRYEEWVNFHLLNGITPGKIDRSQLKQVEAHDVTMVLPLFHHAVERFIALRNRTAYRESVKSLKKMKEYYTIADDTDRFDRFLRQLADRHRRLHAFQEELGKGKLLR